MGKPTIDAKVREYWDWLAVALFVLISVDMVTTVFAARAVGPVGESNPFVRWSLRRGPMAYAGINLAALILAVVLFDRIVALLRRTPARYERYFAAAIEVWLGILLAAGLAVFANNLSVIVYGRSLVVGFPGG